MILEKYLSAKNSVPASFASKKPLKLQKLLQPANSIAIGDLPRKESLPTEVKKYKKKAKLKRLLKRKLKEEDIMFESDLGDSSVMDISVLRSYITSGLRKRQIKSYLRWHAANVIVFCYILTCILLL